MIYAREMDNLIIEWAKMYVHNRNDLVKRKTIELQLKEQGVNSIGMMYISEDYVTIEYTMEEGKRIKQFRKDEI